MGKKLKVGKTRKDKFYHLAKETYRSRSSFKLIQLNRKFQFLQKARALVDLCAAPGLQVASKFMPVSSLIIVDLVPIKPIPNVVTLQEDITTEKCRQAHLTLMALKLACEFLTKGGTFVTKVFRSKDYQPLLWIFQQFFKKVQATKPQASRNESAEIFVICQFVAPDKIDSKFFDPKYAFKEVEVQAKTVKELIPVKKPKAEGYTDGDLTLYHSFMVTDFLKAENPVDFLGKASEITFNNPDLEFHSATSNEIKECCRDIKVLGRKELLLLNWRSKLRRYLAKKLKDEAKQLDQEISDEEGSNSEEEAGKKEDEEEEGEDNEEEEMVKKLAELKAEEVAELKRKKRKLLKEQRKQRERVELKMDLPGVSIASTEDSSLFSLVSIKKKKVKFTNQEEEEEDEEQDGGLVVELEGKDEKMERQADLWFSKGKGKKRKAEEDIKEEEEQQEAALPEEEKAGPSLEAAEESDSDSDDSSNDEEITRMKQARGAGGVSGEVDDDDDFQVVPVESTKKARILSPEGLALGTQIATSKKRARDLVDSSFHFATSDEPWEVPEWFLDDERKHRKRPVPVTKEMVEEYKQKWKEINARPIKRVAEAKARKKRRTLKKMEQAKKKAEAVVNTVDISEREKMAQLKIYKKAGLGKEKREVTYVVSKKGAGKKVRRPPGVKGVFKVVDGRMKKDLRGMQRKEQRAKGGKG
uniref:FtsJ RNA 2'-O-methyltransferase 3 n=1 Tax=Pundamilia nyererei TaxID=303518 RepID=A0A3B4F8B5_9CICH